MKRIYLFMMFMVSVMPLMASCSDDEASIAYEPQPLEPSGSTKTLVAYFPAAGNTHAVAAALFR
ncbi:MAG: hypothetical protein NC344_00525 [Bacteroidales bacterium]|nr:hypothetical protein [Bacteroidales bacterium]MCM1146320.1 hypothetical protein [Bacteroidales bacterium]MCM1205242.1 hypothetical protein [Bacillota bacterium]MCM1509673.1 hypothetical protein [Clostridium sp.]